ncbi:MAG TPA: hypothetical protein VGC00_12780 [Thermoanaerobaculia bacterium]
MRRASGRATSDTRWHERRARRDRLLVAGGLVGGAHLAAVLLLYDAFDWRGHRVLAPAFYAMVLLMLVAAEREAWSRLAEHLAVAPGGTVHLAYSSRFFHERQAVRLMMPVRTADGRPIRYSTSLVRRDGLRRRHRLPIELALLPADEPPGRFEVLADERPFYRLARFPEPSAERGPAASP